jgi:ABC-type multidrug transport system fused ATPase/permease subunit
MFSDWFEQGFLVSQYETFTQTVGTALTSPATYIQVAGIIFAYTVAYSLASNLRRNILVLHNEPTAQTHPLRQLAFRIGNVLYPILAIILMRILIGFGENYQQPIWLLNAAFIVAVLLFFLIQSSLPLFLILLHPAYFVGWVYLFFRCICSAIYRVLSQHWKKYL